MFERLRDMKENTFGSFSPIYSLLRHLWVLLKRLNSTVEKEAPHITALKVELFLFFCYCSRRLG